MSINIQLFNELVHSQKSREGRGPCLIVVYSIYSYQRAWRTPLSLRIPFTVVLMTVMHSYVVRRMSGVGVGIRELTSSSDKDSINEFEGV